ncbi:8455_t:CDS:1, partial [Rhizophagus irregularis]
SGSYYTVCTTLNAFRESWPDIDLCRIFWSEEFVNCFYACPEYHEPIYTSPQQKNITILTDSRRMIHSVLLECSATKAEERKVAQVTAKIKPSQDNKPLNHDIMRKKQKSLSDHLLQKQAC